MITHLPADPAAESEESDDDDEVPGFTLDSAEGSEEQKDSEPNAEPSPSIHIQAEIQLFWGQN